MSDQSFAFHLAPERASGSASPLMRDYASPISLGEGTAEHPFELASSPAPRADMPPRRDLGSLSGNRSHSDGASPSGSDTVYFSFEDSPPRPLQTASRFSQRHVTPDLTQTWLTGSTSSRVNLDLPSRHQPVDLSSSFTGSSSGVGRGVAGPRRRHLRGSAVGGSPTALSDANLLDQDRADIFSQLDTAPSRNTRQNPDSLVSSFRPRSRVLSGRFNPMDIEQLNNVSSLAAPLAPLAGTTSSSSIRAKRNIDRVGTSPDLASFDAPALRSGALGATSDSLQSWPSSQRSGARREIDDFVDASWSTTSSSSSALAAPSGNAHKRLRRRARNASPPASDSMVTESSPRSQPASRRYDITSRNSVRAESREPYVFESLFPPALGPPSSLSEETPAVVSAPSDRAMATLPVWNELWSTYREPRRMRSSSSILSIQAIRDRATSSAVAGSTHPHSGSSARLTRRRSQEDSMDVDGLDLLSSSSSDLLAMIGERASANVSQSTTTFDSDSLMDDVPLASTRSSHASYEDSLAHGSPNVAEPDTSEGPILPLSSRYPQLLSPSGSNGSTSTSSQRDLAFGTSTSVSPRDNDNRSFDARRRLALRQAAAVAPRIDSDPPPLSASSQMFRSNFHRAFDPVGTARQRFQTSAASRRNALLSSGRFASYDSDDVDMLALSSDALPSARAYASSHASSERPRGSPSEAATMRQGVSDGVTSLSQRIASLQDAISESQGVLSDQRQRNADLLSSLDDGSSDMDMTGSASSGPVDSLASLSTSSGVTSPSRTGDALDANDAGEFATMLSRLRSTWERARDLVGAGVTSTTPGDSSVSDDALSDASSARRVRRGMSVASRVRPAASSSIFSPTDSVSRDGMAADRARFDLWSEVRSVTERTSRVPHLAGLDSVGLTDLGSSSAATNGTQDAFNATTAPPVAASRELALSADPDLSTSSAWTSGPDRSTSQLRRTSTLDISGRLRGPTARQNRAWLASERSVARGSSVAESSAPPIDFLSVASRRRSELEARYSEHLGRLASSASRESPTPSAATMSSSLLVPFDQQRRVTGTSIDAARASLPSADRGGTWPSRDNSSRSQQTSSATRVPLEVIDLTGPEHDDDITGGQSPRIGRWAAGSREARQARYEQLRANLRRDSTRVLERDYTSPASAAARPSESGGVSPTRPSFANLYSPNQEFDTIFPNFISPASDAAGTLQSTDYGVSAPRIPRRERLRDALERSSGARSGTLRGVQASAPTTRVPASSTGRTRLRHGDLLSAVYIPVQNDSAATSAWHFLAPTDAAEARRAAERERDLSSTLTSGGLTALNHSRPRQDHLLSAENIPIRPQRDDGAATDALQAILAFQDAAEARLPTERAQDRSSAVTSGGLTALHHSQPSSTTDARNSIDRTAFGGRAADPLSSRLLHPLPSSRAHHPERHEPTADPSERVVARWRREAADARRAALSSTENGTGSNYHAARASELRSRFQSTLRAGQSGAGGRTGDNDTSSSINSHLAQMEFDLRAHWRLRDEILGISSNRTPSSVIDSLPTCVFAIWQGGSCVTPKLEALPVTGEGKGKNRAGPESDRLRLEALAAAASREPRCPICLDEYEADTMLMSAPCNHAFHKGASAESTACNNQLLMLTSLSSFEIANNRLP
ncbi:hypothetical protein IE81DRAFT_345545 [Ceraceosorus guamensis]|uniref:RING-type domain-containing protein n=1 Tax=Ceraceosorus guamensis TaxID=1522189 RepID=A0A316W752_9BASI|nr:hypothetical protein IE81DRAFT_345545 [Ceraceosorus guamensis]PWN44561.1 hypothetical protein IE81DRAFT_345545 [Ceraceosorus guamensis]